MPASPKRRALRAKLKVATHRAIQAARNQFRGVQVKRCPGGVRAFQPNEGLPLPPPIEWNDAASIAEREAFMKFVRVECGGRVKVVKRHGVVVPDMFRCDRCGREFDLSPKGETPVGDTPTTVEDTGDVEVGGVSVDRPTDQPASLSGTEHAPPPTERSQLV